MNNILEKNSYSKEIIGAALVIAFVSLFILANFFVGFSLPIYLLAMIPAAFISFLYPRSGLFAAVFLIFVFERFFTLVPIILGRSEYKLYPLDIIMLAVLFGMILSVIKGQIKIKIGKADILLMIFMAIAFSCGAISILFLEGASALSFSSAKNYGFYALAYFIASILIRTKEDFANLAKFAIAGGIVIIGFLTFGALNGEGLWSEYTPLSTEGVRILAFTHGFYLSMIMVFALAFVLLKKEKSVFLKALSFLIPLWTIGVIGSMMRHLWISLAISSIFVLLISAKKTSENAVRLIVSYMFVIFFIAISLFYISSLFPNSEMSANLSEVTGIVGNRVSSIGNSSDESIFWRNVAWQEAFKQYALSPIFGIGFGKSISVEIGSYREFVEVRNIHNSFLVILVQMGILGISILGYFIITLLKKLALSMKRNDEFEVERITVIGILVLQLVAFIFQPYLETNLLGIFFWINLGLMASLGQENIKTKKH